MSRYVVDTHAFIWHLQTNPRLSTSAQVIFEAADSGQAEVLVPSIVLVEMVYLADKKRIEGNLVQQALDLVGPASQNYIVVPLDDETVEAMRQIDRAAIPDMPDRIITATASLLGLPVVTKDPRITEAGVVSVIW